MSKLEKGKFTAFISIRDGIVFERQAGSLRISPSESTTLVQTLLTVLRTESLRPEGDMQVGPFVVTFGDANLEVRRFEQTRMGVYFEYEDADDFIWLVEQSTIKYQDIARLNPQVRPPAAPMPEPGPV